MKTTTESDDETLKIISAASTCAAEEGNKALNEKIVAASVDPARLDFCSGLRQLADFLEANPVVPLPSKFLSVSIWESWAGDEDEKAKENLERKSLAPAVAKAMRTFEKDVSDSSFVLTKKFVGGLAFRVSFARELVCTKRVIGTRKEIVDVYPTTITPAKVEKEVEIVEWDCPEALLSSSERAEAAP